MNYATFEPSQQWIWRISGQVARDNPNGLPLQTSVTATSGNSTGHTTQSGYHTGCTQMSVTRRDDVVAIPKWTIPWTTAPKGSAK
jgi:hypothetical protein